MTERPYGDDGYERIRDGCRRSADVIVPLILGTYLPSHILDVGCGEGWFASKFSEFGAPGFGMDFVAPATLAPNVHFFERDLALPGSVNVGDFGMVLCLEVAEHLPPERGPSLVEELCAAGLAVAFSAAIPGQGGHRHINERWASYWAALFLDHGFFPDVSLRDLIWNDSKVEPWYRQNLIVYGPPKVRRFARTGRPIDVVHPTIFGWHVEKARDAG